MTDLAADAGEQLENGRRPSTPRGDNLLWDFIDAEASGYGAIAAAKKAARRVDERFGVHMFDLGVATPFGNAAFVSRPIRERDLPEAISAIRSFYDERPGGPFIVFNPWSEPDAVPAGLNPVGHPPLMLRAPGGDQPTVPGFEIELARDADTIADFEQTLMEAYPVAEMLPWQRGSYLDPSVVDSECRFLVGYENGEPVATAAAFVGATVSAVELVSTRARCRGKGYGAAITAAAALAARDRPSMLIASDLGRGVYERLGYMPVFRYTLWLGIR